MNDTWSYVCIRDGLTNKKRNKTYALLCDLAGHPTYEGFRMLTEKYGGDAKCGPYFDFNNMRATLEELAKEMIQAGEIIPIFFKSRSSLDQEKNKEFMKGRQEWSETLKERPPVQQH